MSDPAPVLLVEDNDALRGLYEYILDGAEFAVTTASTVEEALAAIHDMGDLRAVVTDYLLPDGTGAEIIVEVRRRWPLAGVVASTGAPDWLPPTAPGRDIQTLNKPHELAALSAAVRAAVIFPA